MVWCIVHFIEEDNIEVVPQSWFSSEEFECWWPLKCSTEKLKRLIEKKVIPNCGDIRWTTYKARQIGRSYDKLEVARSKSKVAQYQSELTSGGEASPKGKGQRIKIARRIVSSDSSSENEEALPKTKKNKADLRRSPRKVTPQHKTPPRTGHSGELEGGHSSSTPQPFALSMAIPSSSKSLPIRSPSKKTASPRKLTPGFEQTVIRNMNILKAMMRGFGEQLDRVTDNVERLIQKNVDTADRQVDITQLTDLLPAKKLEDVNEVEELLQGKENSTELAKYLARLGGTSVGDMMRRCLRTLLADSVAAQYSWKGQKGKQVFAGLNLKNVLFRAVTMLFREATEKEMEEAIKTWLRPAKSRLCSKSKSRSEADNPIDNPDETAD